MVPGMGDPQPSSPLAEIRRLAACFLPAAEAANVTIAQPPAFGFSGSPVRLIGLEQTGPRYVLKRLPTAVPPEQVAWTQQLARHLAAAGVATVPVPLPARTATGFPEPSRQFAADSAGRLWQCLSFRPGEPIAKPAAGEVVAAVTALAELHRAAARFPIPTPVSRPTGWQTRMQQFERLADTGFAVPTAKPNRLSVGDEDIRQRLLQAGREAAAAFACGGGHRLASRLASSRPARNLQPVLRDCWWPHLLFDKTAAGRCVSGLIDLDAAAVDAPAVDLARLLGSWQLESGGPAQRLRDRWPEAFRQYAVLARPAGDFPTDVQLLHDTAVICGLDRWCDWLFRERREFPDLPRVAGRIEALARALPAALARLSEA